MRFRWHPLSDCPAEDLCPVHCRPETPEDTSGIGRAPVQFGWVEAVFILAALALIGTWVIGSGHTL